jgi:hypothetical protein
VTRASRRNCAQVAQARHPLRLWQRCSLPWVLRRDAMLQLADVAAERACFHQAAVVGGYDLNLMNMDPASSARQWRLAAAGAAVGDIACLLAIGRGLRAEGTGGQSKDCTDASLTALRLAVHGGARAERVVGATEMLIALAEMAGRDDLPVRQARAAAMRITLVRMVRLSISASAANTLPTTEILACWAEVAAAAIRRGLPGQGDRAGLAQPYADLMQATAALPPEDETAPTETKPTRPLAIARPLSRRGRMFDPSLDRLESKADDAPGATMAPFPTFDEARLSDGRSALVKRYAALARPLPVISVPDRELAERALGQLVAEMPNFTAAIERVGDVLALARRLPGRTAIRLPPMLLTGPPGVGKTRFARRLAESLGLEFAWMGLAGSSDSRAMAGTSRGWSGAHASWPVDQVATLGCANPMLLIDEVDKAGGGERNGKATDTLLTLLDAGTAARYQDECLGGPIDLSCVSWILTCNDASALSAPLRSRLTIVAVSPPRIDQVGALIASILRDLADEHAVADARLLPAVPQEILAALQSAYARQPDPRRLRTALARALASAARLEEMPESGFAAVLH